MKKTASEISDEFDKLITGLDGIELKRLKIKVEAFKKLETLEHDIIMKHEKAIINETTGIQEDSTFIANAHSSELDSLRAIAFGQ